MWWWRAAEYRRIFVAITSKAVTPALRTFAFVRSLKLLVTAGKFANAALLVGMAKFLVLSNLINTPSPDTNPEALHLMTLTRAKHCSMKLVGCWCDGVRAKGRGRRSLPQLRHEPLLFT